MRIFGGTLFESFLPLLLFLIFVLTATMLLDQRAETIVKEYQEIVLTPVLAAGNDAYSPTGEMVALPSSESEPTLDHPAIVKSRELEAKQEAGAAQKLLQESLAEIVNNKKDEEKASKVKASLQLQLGILLMRNKQYAESKRYFESIISGPCASELIYYNLALLDARQNRYADAKRNYQKALEIKPTHFESMFNLGLLELKNKNYQKAQNLLQNAVRLSAARARAKSYFALGLAKERLSDRYGAKQAYLKAIEFEPGYLLPRYNLAIMFFEEGNAQGTKKAKQYLDQIDRLNPGFAPSKFLRGRFASGAGDDEMALQWYQKAMRLDPNFYKARYNAGIVAMRLDRQNLAKKIFVNLKSDFPERPEVEFNLGKLAYKAGQYEEALQLYQSALRLSGGKYKEAKSNIGLTLRSLGREKEALAVFDSLLAADTSNASVWVNRALILMGQKKYDEAEESLFKATAYDPKMVSAWYNLGKLELRRKRFQKSKEAYEKVVQLDPEHLKALVNLGIVVSKMDAYVEAVGYYKKALTIAPNYLQARYNLALAYTKLKRYTDAQQEYEAILDVDEEHASALLNLGVVLAKMGNHERAVDVYRRSLDYDPANYKTRFNLALELKKIGKFSNAEVQFRKVLQLKKKHVGSIRSLAMLVYEQGRFEEALKLGKQAMIISPDSKSQRALTKYKAAITKK